MKEGAIESKLCKELVDNNEWVVAAIKINKLGWPDRCLVLRGGIVVWVEFKKDCKKYTLTPAQKKIKHTLTNNGHYYILADCAVGYRTLYERLKETTLELYMPM